jgi:hypothetical protein
MSEKRLTQPMRITKKSAAFAANAAEIFEVGLLTPTGVLFPFPMALPSFSSRLGRDFASYDLVIKLFYLAT